MRSTNAKILELEGTSWLSDLLADSDVIALSALSTETFVSMVCLQYLIY